jgi:tRNA-binding protein
MTPAPVKPAIPVTLLEQIDIRVGTIVSVDEVTGSDKLMRLRVGFGDHERVILAGIRTDLAADVDPDHVSGPHR